MNLNYKIITILLALAAVNLSQASEQQSTTLELPNYLATPTKRSLLLCGLWIHCSNKKLLPQKVVVLLEPDLQFATLTPQAEGKNLLTNVSTLESVSTLTLLLHTAEIVAKKIPELNSLAISNDCVRVCNNTIPYQPPDGKKLLRAEIRPPFNENDPITKLLIALINHYKNKPFEQFKITINNSNTTATITTISQPSLVNNNQTAELGSLARGELFFKLGEFLVKNLKPKANYTPALTQPFNNPDEVVLSFTDDTQK